MARIRIPEAPIEPGLSQEGLRARPVPVSALGSIDTFEPGMVITGITDMAQFTMVEDCLGFVVAPEEHTYRMGGRRAGASPFVQNNPVGELIWPRRMSLSLEGVAIIFPLIHDRVSRHPSCTPVLRPKPRNTGLTMLSVVGFLGSRGTTMEVICETSYYDGSSNRNPSVRLLGGRQVSRNQNGLRGSGEIATSDAARKVIEYTLRQAYSSRPQ